MLSESDEHLTRWLHDSTRERFVGAPVNWSLQKLDGFVNGEVAERDEKYNNVWHNHTSWCSLPVGKRYKNSKKEDA